MGIITMNNAAIDLVPEVNVIASELFDVGGSGGAVILNVQAGDTLAVAIITVYTSLGTTTMTDSTGATWTKYSTSPARQQVWYTNNLATTGNRTITCIADGTFYGYITACTIINSVNTLSGTNATATSIMSSTSLSSLYTTSGPALILSSFFTARGGDVGPASELIPNSYGAGQVLEITKGTDGTGGPPDLRLVITSEYKSASGNDTQSFTNSVSNDSKDLLSFSILKP